MWTFIFFCIALLIVGAAASFYLNLKRYSFWITSTFSFIFVLALIAGLEYLITNKINLSWKELGKDFSMAFSF
jgi:hypothetical protein